MLYNILNPIHTNIQPETAKRLSERPDIVGMKDSEEFAHVQEVVFLTRSNNFRVLDGLEPHFFASLYVGAVGGVLSAANFCPRLCVDIFEKTVAGNYEEALDLQQKLNRMLADLSGFTSWWGVVKTCLSILGICDNTVTHPVRTCTDEERKVLKELMRRYDLV